MKKQTKITPVSDWIYIVPDVPKGGAFIVEGFINETARVEAVGPDVSDSTKKLVGKRVLFNAWACEEKTIDGQKVYFATESSNAIVSLA